MTNKEKTATAEYVKKRLLSELNVNEMTRQELKCIPIRKWNEETICDSLIILPTNRVHNSGYTCMEFVAVKDNKPICRISGCSDVIHFEGIGGFGKDWLEKYGGVPDKIPPSGWNIDCLKKSKLLRIFVMDGKILCGAALSSFDIFSLKGGK